jgi:hypothetical protein
MKKKNKILLVITLILILVFAAAAYTINQSNECDTTGVRPKDCIPANNRCTPPGDPREAVIDCIEFRYYEAR